MTQAAVLLDPEVYEKVVASAARSRPTSSGRPHADVFRVITSRLLIQFNSIVQDEWSLIRAWQREAEIRALYASALDEDRAIAEVGFEDFLGSLGSEPAP